MPRKKLKTATRIEEKKRSEIRAALNQISEHANKTVELLDAPDVANVDAARIQLDLIRYLREKIEREMDSAYEIA